MCVHGRRKVGLLFDPEDVFELNHHELRGRPCQKSLHRSSERFAHCRRGACPRGRFSGQETFAFERRQQPGAIAFPLIDLLIARRLAWKKAELVTHRDIVSLPPSGERRQVVRARRDQRLRGIGGGRQKIVRAGALEIEQAVGEYAGGREGGANLIGNGAQVLADDQASMALARAQGCRADPRTDSEHRRLRRFRVSRTGAAVP